MRTRRTTRHTAWALAFGLAVLALVLPRGAGRAVVADVTIYASATDDKGKAVPGQEIQLTPPETQPPNLELPGPGVPQDQTGHDRDPIQGVTGADGLVVFTGPPEDFGLDPETAGGEYRLPVEPAETKSRVVFVDPGKAPRPELGLPNAIDDFLVGVGPIGTTLALAFAYPPPLDTQVSKSASGIPGATGQEPNTCIDKQPAADGAVWPAPPRGSDLPAARLELGPRGMP